MALLSPCHGARARTARARLEVGGEQARGGPPAREKGQGAARAPGQKGLSPTLRFESRLLAVGFYLKGHDWKRFGWLDLDQMAESGGPNGPIDTGRPIEIQG